MSDTQFNVTHANYMEGWRTAERLRRAGHGPKAAPIYLRVHDAADAEGDRKIGLHSVHMAAVSLKAHLDEALSLFERSIRYAGDDRQALGNIYRDKAVAIANAATLSDNEPQRRNLYRQAEDGLLAAIEAHELVDRSGQAVSEVKLYDLYRLTDRMDEADKVMAAELEAVWLPKRFKSDEAHNLATLYLARAANRLWQDKTPEAFVQLGLMNISLSFTGSADERRRHQHALLLATALLSYGMEVEAKDAYAAAQQLLPSDEKDAELIKRQIVPDRFTLSVLALQA